MRLTIRGARANGVRSGTVEAAIAEALVGVTARDRAATKRVLERLCAPEPADPGAPNGHGHDRTILAKETHMTLGGQVRVGDYVKLDSGQEGYVVDFSWRSTRLRVLANSRTSGTMRQSAGRP